jgi:hypothetical protein
MDYKTEMNEKKKDFFEFYSERMKELEKKVEISEEVSKLLEEKRKFGAEKYGEYSFQTTFENAVTSPSEEHLREELIDAINYALHSIYKSALYLKDDRMQIEFLNNLVKMYNKSFDVF